MFALHLLVRDAPGSVEWYQQALNAAAVTRLLRLPVRTGEVLDPSGHRWAFDQELRDVPAVEIGAEIAAMFAGK
jgi:hypothetical protein